YLVQGRHHQYRTGAVVESLALGTPIVGYRRGCLPELVDDVHLRALGHDGSGGDALWRGGWQVVAEGEHRLQHVTFPAGQCVEQPGRLLDRQHIGDDVPADTVAHRAQ
ncbi:MAG: hypothetical protein QOC83_208, partial [Pseudonocardiales bacterium]|nr:hypothetical protein [Pseudonocardiales bacterium]